MRNLSAAFLLALTAACAHGSAASGTGGRIPDRDSVLESAQARWGDQLQQIPSFVIDNGPLALVPYYSYRASDFEVNVYGDPAAPACVEVGTYKDDEESRRIVRALVDKLLPKREDAAEIGTLNPAGEARERQGLTLEATPPNAPDAYGAWWVSVYSKDALAAARAELAEAISEATSEEEEKKDAARKRSRSWSRSSYSRSSRYVRSAPNTRVYTRSYSRSGKSYIPSPWRR